MIAPNEPERMSAADYRSLSTGGSRLERVLLISLQLRGIEAPVREWVFAPPRKFRADFAWPHRSLIVEVEGGTWIAGRHSRGGGVRSDCEKSALAAARGLRMIRVEESQVKSGQAAKWIEEALRWEA